MRGIRHPLLERLLEGRRLGGVVDDADAPLRRELRREERTGCRGVRLVDEPEVAFEAIDDGRVGPQQRAVRAQQVLEGGLPPRELELRADPVLAHVPHRELDEQGLEAESFETRYGDTDETEDASATASPDDAPAAASPDDAPEGSA